MTTLNEAKSSTSTETQNILARLNELGHQQSECFRHYITVLQKQESLISTDSEESILASIDREEQIVADIFAIQKAIEPLEEMYYNIHPASSAQDNLSYKAEVQNLHKMSKAQSERNRELLSQRMETVRSEINLLKNNPLIINARRSVYRTTGTASLIDIRG